MTQRETDEWPREKQMNDPERNRWMTQRETDEWTREELLAAWKASESLPVALAPDPSAPDSDQASAYPTQSTDIPRY